METTGKWLGYHWETSSNLVRETGLDWWNLKEVSEDG